VRPGLAAAPGGRRPTVPDATLSAGLGLAPRTDGTQQLTFKVRRSTPTFGDIQPGDITGQAATVSGSS